MRVEKKDADEINKYSNSKCEFCGDAFEYLTFEYTKHEFLIRQILFTCGSQIDLWCEEESCRYDRCYENEIKALKQKLQESK